MKESTVRLMANSVIRTMERENLTVDQVLERYPKFTAEEKEQIKAEVLRRLA